MNEIKSDLQCIAQNKISFNYNLECDKQNT
jgi:hypothetical protein